MSAGLSELASGRDLERAESADACNSQHCVTCGDDGDPMTVVRVDLDRGLALCRGEDGASVTVETALVEPVAPGECLLVHAGTAIARIDSPDQRPA